MSEGAGTGPANRRSFASRADCGGGVLGERFPGVVQGTPARAADPPQEGTAWCEVPSR